MILFVFPSIYSYVASAPASSKSDLWLVLHLKNYKTDMPISNTSITLTFYTSKKEVQLGPASTNETGIVQFSFGDVLSLFYSKSIAMKIAISNNYTLIKINETFLENIQYTGEYSQNYTRYEITGKTQLWDIFKFSGILKTIKNQNFFEMVFWVLKGKLIRISDSDPLTGMKDVLSLKPAVKAIVENETAAVHERYYFFPLDYDVIISYAPKYPAEWYYPPLKVKVEENTSLINWMYHAEKAYADSEIPQMNEEIAFLTSSGFSLDREIKEYNAIKNLISHVLDLYQKREYGSAFGGSRIAKNKIDSLKAWLSSIKNYAVATSIGICLFIYSLASFVPTFVFEEPAQKKARLLGKVLIFASFLLAFSLTHPSIKVTYATLISQMIGVPISNVDLPTILLGCFIIGSLTYFLLTLLFIKKSPVTDLALRLGMRNLKRRPFRSILTLTTITIIVFSSIIFVNISMSRSTKVREAWKGTEREGVLVQPDTRMVTVSIYDINWTLKQKWCKDLGYIEEIREYEFLSSGNIMTRTSLILQDNQTVPAKIVAIDPVFMEKYYNLSEHVRGFWHKFLNEKNVAITSTTYNIPTNGYVTLGVDEVLETETGGLIPLGTRIYGDFQVVGTFDPSDLSKLIKIDGKPLFTDTLNLILIPVGSVNDPSIAISEVTIITGEEDDPVEVAEKMAYLLGVPTVANKGGIARRIEWSLELSASGLMPFLVPLVISGLMVYTTMASVYEERKREFVTLATLGLDPKNTFKIFIIEAFLLGLIGTLIGFLGSYVFITFSFYLANLLKIGTAGLSAASTNWSIFAILVALFTGIFMALLGSYIPAVRAQGLSLMGRVKKRRFIGELVTEGNSMAFTLPVRETVQNSEMLYTYIREALGDTKISHRIDVHSIKGEVFIDGSFTVSFIALGSGGSVLIPCEIRGVREEEILIPVLYFPKQYREYNEIRDILRDLEEHMIGFSSWKEMQRKMKIVREAPKRRKTLEEILDEMGNVIVQIKDCEKKLKILEAQKDKISEEVYGEFRQKYIEKINELSKKLRSMTIGLEPHSRRLLDEIKKVEVEVERITMAYNLGEIGEGEYIKMCGPLQGRLADLKRRLNEIEEIYKFLKMPSKLTKT